MIFGFRDRFWQENFRNRTCNLRWALQKVFLLLDRKMTRLLSQRAPLRCCFFVDFGDLKTLRIIN